MFEARLDERGLAMIDARIETENIGGTVIYRWVGSFGYVADVAEPLPPRVVEALGLSPSGMGATGRPTGYMKLDPCAPCEVRFSIAELAPPPAPVAEKPPVNRLTSPNLQQTACPTCNRAKGEAADSVETIALHRAGGQGLAQIIARATGTRLSWAKVATKRGRVTRKSEVSLELPYPPTTKAEHNEAVMRERAAIAAVRGEG